MILAGCLIGAALFYLGAAPFFPHVAETPWWKVLLCLAMGCLMIPAPPSMDIRGWEEINSLNGAGWSLYFEYFANILYALLVRHFSKLLLAVFVALSAVLTIDLSFDIDLFGLLGDRGEAAYTVIGGWSLAPDQLYIGFARLCYPFFMGLLLSRLRGRIPLRGGFWWCSLAVAAILVSPCLGGDAHPWMNGAYNALAILVLFPLVVTVGAGSRASGRRSSAACQFLGEISYPLYITHYPWLYLHMNWAARHADAPPGTHIFVAAGIFVLVIAIAYACLKLYDEPVRDWLRVHLLLRGK